MSNAPKPLKIENGDGTDLDISPVYDHLSIQKPKKKENPKQDIVIPKEKK